MPAKSRAQRIAIAIAEHHPEQLYERNRGLLKMSHSQMHDFAATPEKGLPDRINNMKRRGAFRRKKTGFAPPPMSSTGGY